MTLLEITDLRLQVTTGETPIDVVKGISLEVGRGETLGLVGESGSGKSLTALSVMGLLPSPAVQRASGSIRFDGVELTELDDRGIRSYRGKRVGMIFQNPLTALNPSMTVGGQIIEILRAHTDLSRRAAAERAIELLDMVGIAAPRQRAKEYPHQLSGGMRQRVMIAMALSCEPDLLIADEPTTALDVTVQAQILDLLRTLVSTTGSGLIIVTHDLGVVAGLADRIAVMYAGEIVEHGSANQVLTAPAHQYTAALLRSIPRHDIAARGKLPAIEGEPPSPGLAIVGCPFAARCPAAIDLCRTEKPPVEFHPGVHGGSDAACWVPATSTGVAA